MSACERRPEETWPVGPLGGDTFLPLAAGGHVRGHCKTGFLRRHRASRYAAVQHIGCPVSPDLPLPVCLRAACSATALPDVTAFRFSHTRADPVTGLCSWCWPLPSGLVTRRIRLALASGAGGADAVCTITMRPGGWSRPIHILVVNKARFDWRIQLRSSWPVAVASATCMRGRHYWIAILFFFPGIGSPARKRMMSADPVPPPYKALFGYSQYTWIGWDWKKFLRSLTYLGFKPIQSHSIHMDWELTEQALNSNINLLFYIMLQWYYETDTTMFSNICRLLVYFWTKSRQIKRDLDSQYWNL
jgi:hypothetical protein